MSSEIKKIGKDKRPSQVRPTLPKLGQRKGVSLMIGYVLLITLAIVMGIVAYNWMKTYLPREPTQCPDGSSLFIKEAAFNSSNSQLILTLKNNGRFNILGYYIYATNSSEQKVATIELSKYLNNNSEGERLGNSVSFFSGSDNSFTANDEATHTFTIPVEIGTLYSISITPTRIETEDNKERFTVCSDLGVGGIVGEPFVECVPDCGGLECGPDPVCGASCGICTGDGEFCNLLNGHCEIPIASCGDAILQVQNGEQCDDGNAQHPPSQNGIECTPSYGSSCDYCSSLCQIFTKPGFYCGDGILTTPNEQCDDGDNPPADGDGCSSICQIESGWTCNTELIPNECSLSQEQISYSGFESGIQDWIGAGPNSDRSNARSKVTDLGANGGAWSWHIQNSGSTSTFYQNFDFTGYDRVVIRWWGYYSGINSESDKNECMELQVDNVKAASWGYPGSSILCTHDIHSQNNQWLDEEVTILGTDYTFDSSVKIGFVSKFDTDTDDFYADGISIIGIND